ncbi:MAG: hypothetical protein AB1898_12765 [Acidobacteriota bacterium]
MNGNLLFLLVASSVLAGPQTAKMVDCFELFQKSVQTREKRTWFPTLKGTSVAPAAARKRMETVLNLVQGGQAKNAVTGVEPLEDVEERQGPFKLEGQNFTVVLRYKRLPGKVDPDSRTLVSLEIRDATGGVRHQTSLSPAIVENGAFIETCSATVRLLSGKHGTGLLIDSGCLPSAPLSGGPWQVVGVVEGQLVSFGKPLVAEGELGQFVLGAVSPVGVLRQITPDILKIRVWTGYFFVSVPVSVDWVKGRLELGQHCFYQTGQGMAEEGCKMPAEEARLAAREQAMTFVRLFQKSNQRSGPPAHVVVKPDSRIEVLAGKVLITWEEGLQSVQLSVGQDLWVKVRIDGKEGWIHTPEDLNAIGLFSSG